MKKDPEVCELLVDRIKNLDDGIYRRLLNVLDFKWQCFNCASFDDINLSFDKGENYRCACEPFCIGVTLSKQLQYYILFKLNIITKDQAFGL